jgi:hypothetical protein
MSAVPFSAQPSSVQPSASRRPLPAAGAATGLAVVYGALYAFASGSEDNPVRAFFVIAGLSLLAAVPLFRFGVPVWGSRAAVVLAVLSLVGTVAYWAGVPAVLGVAALSVAWSVAQEAGRWSRPARVAAGIAGLALVLQLVASVLG